MMQDFLPVGSVVLLKGGTRRLFITGRVVAPNTGSEIFDYAGCPFPEGMTSLEQIYCFNRDQIEQVFFIGFQDSEELQMQERLSQLGELYIKDGAIVEREPEDAPDTASAADDSAAAVEDTDVVETAVFADVE